MRQMWFVPVPLCRQYSVFIYFCKVSAGIFIDCIQKRIRFQRYASWPSVFRYTKNEQEKLLPVFVFMLFIRFEAL